MNESSQSTVMARAAGEKKAKPWQRVSPFLITIACFAYLDSAINRDGVAQGTTPSSLYLAKSFENVNWEIRLALMVPYCFLYLIFDSLGVWCAINWFNAKIRYGDSCPFAPVRIFSRS